MQQRLPLAEKSYRGAYEILQHEMGDSIMTANLLGDIARVCNDQSKKDEAIKLLGQVVSLYGRFPNYADTDTASALELFSSLMSERKQYKMADALAKIASHVRSRNYGDK